MSIMNIKCFQFEIFLRPIAPEFSVKYLVLFNTILSILLYINYIYVNYNLYIYKLSKLGTSQNFVRIILIIHLRGSTFICTSFRQTAHLSFSKGNFYWLFCDDCHR